MVVLGTFFELGVRNIVVVSLNIRVLSLSSAISEALSQMFGANGKKSNWEGQSPNDWNGTKTYAFQIIVTIRLLPAGKPSLKVKKLGNQPLQVINLVFVDFSAILEVPALWYETLNIFSAGPQTYWINPAEDPDPSGTARS